MENHNLAIPYVPMQQWGQTYDPARALAEGTVFPDLNLCFFAAPCGDSPAPEGERDPRLLFSQICFVLDDVLLYLDTHPEDGRAKEFYGKCLQKKRELMEKTACGCSMADHYEWADKPLVWEGGHC